MVLSGRNAIVFCFVRRCVNDLDLMVVDGLIKSQRWDDNTSSADNDVIMTSPSDIQGVTGGSKNRLDG